MSALGPISMDEIRARGFAPDVGVDIDWEMDRAQPTNVSDRK